MIELKVILNFFYIELYNSFFYDLLLYYYYFIFLIEIYLYTKLK